MILGQLCRLGKDTTKTFFRWLFDIREGSDDVVFFTVVTATPRGSKRIHTKIVGAYRTKEQAERAGELALAWFPAHNATIFGEYPKYRVEFLDVGQPPNPALWDFVFDMEEGGRRFGE